MQFLPRSILPRLHQRSPLLLLLLSPMPSAARAHPHMAPSFSSNLPARPVSCFPTASRKIGSGSGIGGDEFDKPSRHGALHSANCNVVALGDHTTIIQGVNDEEKKGQTAGFIAHSGDGPPTSDDEEDGRMAKADADYAYEDASRLTVDATDGKEDAGMAPMELEDARRETKNVTAFGGDGHSEDDDDNKEDEREEIEFDYDNDYDSTSDDDDIYFCDDIWHTEQVIPKRTIENSSHRDGSIYRGGDDCQWKTDYSIADRNENPKDCGQDAENCRVHRPHRMLQIFSLKLAKIPVDGGSVELYGYIAVQDSLEPLLNYIVNLSRDSPIIVEQGSLITMTGPKRGIQMYGTILIEYDMRIKTGEQDRDLQLIDGVFTYDDSTFSGHEFTNRICGDCGAVDITVSLLDSAVEATIEVTISEVRRSFNLSLGSFFSGLHEEIQLFHGTICEPRGLRRSVVAVMMGTWMHLKFNVCSGSYSCAEHCCSFKAKKHRYDSHELKTGLGIISVKVTWSTLSTFCDRQKKVLLLW
uniref:DUF6598 domain-containing protein n=1 Tax=Oryza punctata TaxID=4537 RepID=A0A0E0MM28_ORYPU